jgi:DedD protein
MFESRHRGSGGNSANRWLIVAGAGLVILAFVARMLLDIGHTRVSDLTAALHPDTAAAAAATPAPAESTPAPPAAQPVVSDTQGPPPPSPDAVASPATPPPAQSAAPQPPATPPEGSASKGVHTVTAQPPVLHLDTTTPGSRYVVQIGAFGSGPNAEKLSQRATALGFQAAVIAQVRNGTTLYLVRVMRAGNAADARMVSDSLESALGVKAVVLRPGQ